MTEQTLSIREWLKGYGVGFGTAAVLFGLGGLILGVMWGCWS